MKRLLLALSMIAALGIPRPANAQASLGVFQTFALNDAASSYAYPNAGLPPLNGQSACTFAFQSSSNFGGGTLAFYVTADHGTTYIGVTGIQDVGNPANNAQQTATGAPSSYTIPVGGMNGIEVVLTGSSGASIAGSLNCNTGVAFNSDTPPLVSYGPVTVSANGDLPALPLTGQSTCSLTEASIAGGTATLTPYGSADSGNTYADAAGVGGLTGEGTSGGNVAPQGITNFKVNVSSISGSVSVFYCCSAALVLPASGK